MPWIQKTVQLRPRSRGCHLITSEIMDGLAELTQIRIGLLHVFIQHTSASLTINENADSDVRVDRDLRLRKETHPIEREIVSDAGAVQRSRGRQPEGDGHVPWNTPDRAASVVAVPMFRCEKQRAPAGGTDALRPLELCS